MSVHDAARTSEDLLASELAPQGVLKAKKDVPPQHVCEEPQSQTPFFEKHDQVLGVRPVDGLSLLVRAIGHLEGGGRRRKKPTDRDILQLFFHYFSLSSRRSSSLIDAVIQNRFFFDLLHTRLRDSDPTTSPHAPSTRRRVTCLRVPTASPPTNPSPAVARAHFLATVFPFKL
jgi:hypothetical protein